MNGKPDLRASDKAKGEMKKAVDKVIDDKKKEPTGTEEAEQKVAADLNKAARQDTKR